MYERTIAGDITYRGGYIPRDKAWVYYVVGRDGRRFRCLHLMALPGENFRIGTRSDFRAVYTSTCYSHRQRKIAQQCRLLRLTTRQRKRVMRARPYTATLLGRETRLQPAPLNVSVFKQRKERARNILRASPVKPRELRTRRQPKPHDILQDCKP